MLVVFHLLHDIDDLVLDDGHIRCQSANIIVDFRNGVFDASNTIFLCAWCGQNTLLQAIALVMS
jgi:hypothetical protein